MAKSRPLRTTLLVACALIGGCAGQPSVASAPSASAVVTSSPEPSTASPTPTPTPSQPAELVLRISHAHFANHWTSTSLVADGRLTTPSDTGWIVRTLTSVGVERVRNKVLGTGLFSESRALPLVLIGDPVACTDGLGRTSGDSIEVVADGTLVAVSWDVTNAPDGCYEPSAERDALNALFERLSSPDAWLPADAWEDQTARPLEVEAFRLVTVSQPHRADLGELPAAAAVEWPLAKSLFTYGDEMASPVFGTPSAMRCGVVSAQEGEMVADALTDAGAGLISSVPPGFASIALLDDPDMDMTVAVILEALPPDQSSCEDVNLGFLNCWDVGGAPIFHCAVP